MSNPRDHGRPSFDNHGTPRFVRMLTDPSSDGCPHCHCAHVAELEIDVTDPRLSGGKGVRKYVGCPACPWASPMVVISAGTRPAAEGAKAP